MLLQLIPARHVVTYRYRKLRYEELWVAVPKAIEAADRLLKMLGDN